MKNMPLSGKLTKGLGRLLQRPSSRPRQFPSSGYNLIDSSLKVEEENNVNYKPAQFYAAQIGEVFQSRYQLVRKLGYGSSSTVWLCRDLQ